MMGPRRVLLTGSCGLVGRSAARALSESGINVVGTSSSGRLVPGVDTVPVDLTNERAVEQLAHSLGTFETIVHAAADVPPTFDSASAARALSRNLAMLTHVGMLLAPLGRLVFLSSTSVYGSRSGEAVGRDHEAHPENLYAVSKLAGEHIARVLAHAQGGSAVSLRLSAPYGAGQSHRTVLQLFVERAVKGQPLQYFGTGSRTQDFTHVDDIAAAIVMACHTGHGHYNVASGQPIAMRTLAELVVAIVGRPGAKVEAAGFPDPQEDYRAQWPLERTIRELGFRARWTLEEGIRSLAEHVS